MLDKSESPTPDGVREQLIRVTIRLLAEQGPSGIKARTVASAAGLSTMVVYHHFGGIPELTRAVVDHGFKELDDALSQLPVTEDPITDLAVEALTCRRVACGMLVFVLAAALRPSKPPTPISQKRANGLSAQAGSTNKKLRV
jgi:AcrR family transcriptional regulator